MLFLLILLLLISILFIINLLLIFIIYIKKFICLISQKSGYFIKNLKYFTMFYKCIKIYYLAILVTLFLNLNLYSIYLLFKMLYDISESFSIYLLMF